MKIVNYSSRTEALRALRYNETILLSYKPDVLASREQAFITATADQLKIKVKTDTALVCVAGQVSQNVIMVTRILPTKD